MRYEDRSQTDADLKAMLRTEIIELRTLLAQRDAEIAALLQQSNAEAIEDSAVWERDGSFVGWVRTRARRLRHRLVLRRQAVVLSKSSLFDAGWYATHHPECGGPDNAVVHYLEKGAFAGHDPGPNFSTKAYYQANPDVAAEGWPALAHFLMHGQAEGRRLGTVSEG